MKILDGSIKTEILDDGTKIVKIKIKMEENLYGKVEIKQVEDIGNIEIIEGSVIVIDTDKSFKHIDVELRDSLTDLLLGDEVDYDNWCKEEGTENLEKNYYKHISTVLYSAVIGAVCTVL